MSRRRTKKGIALTSTLLLIIVFLLIGVSVVGLTTMQSRYSMKAGFDARTREAALAGVRVLQDVLSDIDDWNQMAISGSTYAPIRNGLQSQGYIKDGAVQGKHTFTIGMFSDCTNELEIVEVKNDSVIALSSGFVTADESRQGRKWEKTYRVIYRKNRFRYAAASLNESGTGIYIPSDSRVYGDVCCLSDPEQTACIVGYNTRMFRRIDGMGSDGQSEPGDGALILPAPPSTNTNTGSGATVNPAIDTSGGGKTERSLFSPPGGSDRAFVPDEGGDSGGGGGKTNPNEPDGQGKIGDPYKQNPGDQGDDNDYGIIPQNGGGDDPPMTHQIIVNGSVSVPQNSAGKKAVVTDSGCVRDGVKGYSSPLLRKMDFTEMASFSQPSAFTVKAADSLSGESLSGDPLILNAGAYQTDDLKVTSPLSIKPVGGPVCIFVNNSVSIKADLTIIGDPRNFMVFCRGASVTIGGSKSTTGGSGQTTADTDLLTIEREEDGKIRYVIADPSFMASDVSGVSVVRITNLFLEAPAANITINRAVMTGSIIGNTILMRNSSITYPMQPPPNGMREKGRALIISLEELAKTR
jgi:Tfp pilus assembly protein PilX